MAGLGDPRVMASEMQHGRGERDGGWAGERGDGVLIEGVSLPV